jgi:hypothetical protein
MTVPRRRLYWTAAMTAVAMTGCTVIGSKEPSSAIVEKLEKAGAGNLSTATTGSIQQWLGQRRSLADEVDAMCKPIRATAEARWADSTEGRICTAAQNLAFFRYKRREGDGETFRAGSK